MILAGDGHTNIVKQKDGSLPNKRTNSYDLVITNIPFTLPINYNIEGMMYDVPSNNGNSISIQHILDSLKKQKGSRAAIVVPEQVIFIDELIKTREFMINNFDIKVFSLPQGVFLPYAIAKTCIIFLEWKGELGNLEFINIDNVGFTTNNSKENIDQNDLSKYIENNGSDQKYKIDIEDLKLNKFIFKPIYKKYSGVKIEDILEVSKRNIDLKKNEDYFEITVKNYGNGVIQREYDKKLAIKTKKGSDIRSKRYVILDEVFTYSTLDARNGGFGKINSQLKGAVYSNTYVCFKLKNKYRNLNLDFLTKILSSNEFIEYFTKISNGTTNRRSVKKEEFLKTRLPFSKEKLMEKSIIFTKLQNKLEEIDKEKNKFILEQNLLFK